MAWRGALAEGEAAQQMSMHRQETSFFHYTNHHIPQRTDLYYTDVVSARPFLGFRFSAQSPRWPMSRALGWTPQLPE